MKEMLVLVMALCFQQTLQRAVQRKGTNGATNDSVITQSREPLASFLDLELVSGTRVGTALVSFSLFLFLFFSLSLTYTHTPSRRTNTFDQRSLCKKDSSSAKATCCWRALQEAVIETSAHLVLHTQSVVPRVTHSAKARSVSKCFK